MLGLVIKELSANDINFATVISSGEWIPLLTRRDMAVLIDNRNTRTLVIQRTIDKRIRKDFTVKSYEISITWYLIGRKITKNEAIELYKSYKKRKPKFLAPVRKVKIDRKPFNEIEIIKMQIENLEFIRKHGYNLTKGQKSAITRKINKLKKKLEELRI